MFTPFLVFSGAKINMESVSVHCEHGNNAWVHPGSSYSQGQVPRGRGGGIAESTRLPRARVYGASNCAVQQVPKLKSNEPSLGFVKMQFFFHHIQEIIYV